MSKNCTIPAYKIQRMEYLETLRPGPIVNQLRKTFISNWRLFTRNRQVNYSFFSTGHMISKMSAAEYIYIYSTEFRPDHEIHSISLFVIRWAAALTAAFLAYD